MMTSPGDANLEGRRIGGYQIQTLIGAGGMGEVYRAHDTKLGRDVAIKILPREFLTNAERLARFEREARTLAALNHPHIAAIYGIEQDDDLRAIVLELVPGDTLADRLLGGAIPVADAVAIARQIADALDAAHEKGIVHRDLKPSNIKITPDDVVKVLDFGLAKASGEEWTANVAQSPTITVAGTSNGVILGTAGYMSPEQARGRAVDRRADIWAFGCVLYEMLTGSRAFGGETTSDTIAAIIEREPDWSRLPASTPPAIHRLLHRSLHKDAKRRLRDIGDARADLEDAITAASDVAVRLKPDTTYARSAYVLFAAAIVTSLLAIAAVIWNRIAAPPATTVVNLQRITDSVGVEEHPAASPDGKTVAFIAPANGRRQVWVRLLAGGTPLQITNDDVDHEHPRWTPDSSSLVFFTGATDGNPGMLAEVSALGGTPRRIAPAEGGGDISHDSRFIATFQRRDGRTVLAILARDGSKAERELNLPPLEEFSTPRWSPDDRSIAFVGAIEIAFNRSVYVIDATDGEAKAVANAQNIQGAAWLPDGSGLVYASSAGSTMTYPPVYNLRTVARDGGGERQLTFGDVSYVQPDVVASGKLFASRVRMQSDIWRFPITGTPAENVSNGTRITHQTGQVQTPSASPDGTEVVYLSDNGGHVNLWVAKVDGSSTRQITFERDPAVVIGIPVWSPTGDRIVMIRSQNGVNSEWLINPDGSSQRELVPRSAGAAWSRDGKWLYYFTPKSANDSSTCIDKIPIDGGKAVRVRCDGANVAVAGNGSAIYYVPHVSRPGEIRQAQPEDGADRSFVHIAPARIPLVPQGFALSPDDGWLAMPLKDAGTSNIWAFPTDGGAPRQLTDFGRRPILIARQVSWSPDGKFVYAAVVETDSDIVLLDGMR